MGETASLQKAWQAKIAACTADAIRTSQKTGEEYLCTMDQGARDGMEVLKATLGVCCSTAIVEVNTKMRDLSAASIATVQQTVLKVMEANARLLKSWTAFCGVDGERQANASN